MIIISLLMNKIRTLCTFLLLVVVSVGVNAQQIMPTCAFTIRNETQVSDRVLEFDVYLLNTNPSVKFEVSGVQMCITMNSAILNGGTITPSVVSGSSEMVSAQIPTAFQFDNANPTGVPMFKVAVTSSEFGSSTVISGTNNGTRVCRFRFTNSVAFALAKANLQFRMTLPVYRTLLSYWDQGSDGLGITSTDPAKGDYLDLPLSSNNAYSATSDPELSSTATVTTDAVNVSTNVATGTMSYLGSPSATNYGFVYSSTNPTPTITDTYISKGAASTSGSYTASLTGLTGGTTYYVRAFATNSAGTTYGSVLSFTAATFTSTIAVVGSTSYTYNKLPQGPSVANVTGSTGAVTYSYSGTGSTTYAASSTRPTKAGTYQVIVSVAADANYGASSSSPYAFSINKADLTISGITTSNKVYDGSTVATLSGGVLTGVVSGDDVSLVSGSGVFADRNVGSGKAITLVGYSLSGVDANNYALSLPSGLSANVTAIKLTISAPSITLSKVNNGTINAEVVAGSLSGVLLADVANVVVTAIGTYDNANVGTSKTITVNYSLNGSASGNYIAPDNTIVTNGVIIASASNQVSISTPTLIRSKVYDGTSSAIVVAGALSGVDPADVGNVSVIATANYDDANAGTGKAITVSYSLTGSAANKYTIISEVIYSNGEILRKPLTISKSTVVATEVEDGIVVAEISSLGELQGLIPIDVNSVSVKAFATVGSDKKITLAYSLIGSAKDNYSAPSDSIISDVVISSSKLSSDYIVRIYNDVVACDNRENRFEFYQWYKNGVLITGATDQFYCEEAGLNGSYFVRVITTDGEVLFSEEKVFTSLVSIKKISTYPNPVKTNNSFIVSIDGLDSKELDNTSLSIYTLQGTCVYQLSKVEKQNTVYLSIEPQVCIGRIKVKDGLEQTFKVVIEK
jgi:hypothetical protein